MSADKRSTILVVYAHPDDETFTTGGVLAHYAAQGHRVALICATRGEVGEISDPALATAETLGQVREEELRCAANALGLSELIFLGYRDSGMAGTAENQHPEAFANAAAEEVVARLVGHIRRLQPDVVITFDPGGGYGHPDHIAVHRHTVAAFHAAADPAYSADGVMATAWQAQRLYYDVLPRSMLERIRDAIAAIGADARFFEETEVEALAWPDEAVNVTMDVSAYVDTKRTALLCHATQFGTENVFRRVIEAYPGQLLGVEHYALVWPQPQPGWSTDDLLAGLNQA